MCSKCLLEILCCIASVSEVYKRAGQKERKKTQKGMSDQNPSMKEIFMRKLYSDN